MEPQSSQVDIRIDFLGNYVQKTLKLKPEKWTRMLATEENKAVIKKFLERPHPVVLIVVLTQTAQLIATNGFPLPQLKNKGENFYNSLSLSFYLKIVGVYFIKKNPMPVSKDKPSETIILGDLSSKIIDQLASFVDEVYPFFKYE